MNYKIKHPEHDIQGNPKENIYLAINYHDEIIGHAYVYPSYNFYQTFETPLLLYFECHCESIDIKKDLLNHVYQQALNLRKKDPNLNATFYTSTNSQLEKSFYLDDGFDDAHTLIMEKNLNDYSNDFTNEQLETKNVDLTNPVIYAQYISIYNMLFVTPLDHEKLLNISLKDNYRNVYYMKNQEIVGGSTLYISNDIGFLETLYVTPTYQSFGFSNRFMYDIFSYFNHHNIKKINLEVWSINKKAVYLYESLGFKKTKEVIYTPFKRIE